MNTIYAGLPFYDSLTKQEKNRTNSKIPFYTPATHLPPFQICDVIGNVPTAYEVYLVSYTCGGPASSGASSDSTVITADSTITADGAAMSATSETEISSLFSVDPVIASLSTNFYITYSGAALISSLARGTYYLRIETNAGETYYSEHFTIIDTTKGSWCKLEFSNSDDLGNILYATGGFEQIVYLNTQLVPPVHEIVEVGEEKDGEFITEKLVTKFEHKIITYVNRALYQCLVRLPQHDDITITDDVGNVYTPSVGNVAITAEAAAFDLIKVTIQFNDGAETAFAWTYDMTNMT